MVIILTVNIVSQEDADTGKVGNPVSIDLAAAAAVAAPEEPVAPAPAPVVRRAPAAKAMGGGGGANNNKGPGGPIYPIEGLSPYQNKSVLPLVLFPVRAHVCEQDTNDRE